MMKVDLQGIADRKQWEDKGYHLPEYDIGQMREATKENPFWIHFGAGNLFRAFHAAIVEKMLNEGKLDRGLGGNGDGVFLHGQNFTAAQNIEEKHILLFSRIALNF